MSACFRSVKTCVGFIIFYTLVCCMLSYSKAVSLTYFESEFFCNANEIIAKSGNFKLCMQLEAL